MKKIVSSNAPKPVGAYSQGIKINDMIFVSGQIPIIPETEKLVSEDIERQTLQVLENIKNILAEESADFSKIVKTQIFLKDINDFELVNRIYSQQFTDVYPARDTVEVSRLPKDAKIEMSVIAFIK